MILGDRADVIRPNVASATDVSGLLNCAWLKALKNSPRSCRFTRSVTAKTRCAPRSTFTVPGPIKMLRPAFPKVLGAGILKQLVSNHCATLAACEPPVYFALQDNCAWSLPFSGRLKDVSLPDVMFSGNPLCQVQIPELSQPPRIALASPDRGEGSIHT